MGFWGRSVQPLKKIWLFKQKLRLLVIFFLVKVIDKLFFGARLTNNLTNKFSVFMRFVSDTESKWLVINPAVTISNTFRISMDLIARTLEFENL